MRAAGPLLQALLVADTQCGVGGTLGSTPDTTQRRAARRATRQSASTCCRAASFAPVHSAARATSCDGSGAAGHNGQHTFVQGEMNNSGL